MRLAHKTSSIAPTSYHSENSVEEGLRNKQMLEYFLQTLSPVKEDVVVRDHIDKVLNDICNAV